MSEITHTREFDAFPGFQPEPDVETPAGPATPSATGRAARRRRLADWKKQRRRAVVASTVALVGGGLTLAFMPSSRPSAGQAQASSTPDPTVAPPTSSVDGTDTTTGAQTERPRVRVPEDARTGSGPSKAARGTANSPGSATSIAPVDAPAKRGAAQAGAPSEAGSSSPASPASPTTPTTPPASATPETPPTALQPTTPPPSEPAQPTPTAPPTAEPSTQDPGLCVLVLCVDLDGKN
ncbi:hypothetical protein OG875_13610 [Streptomyces sp. NBC_01498]|nr:hypothetical protein [Streptomyces sp. NBC_01498]WTL25537.1 hypothetical protein OG875_13610 [Streptomyces sp. NBC_01498]